MGEKGWSCRTEERRSMRGGTVGEVLRELRKDEGAKRGWLLEDYGGERFQGC
jgi:hypothetical protein